MKPRLTISVRRGLWNLVGMGYADFEADMERWTAKERREMEAARAWLFSVHAAEVAREGAHAPVELRALVSEKPPEEFNMNKAWFAALAKNPEASTVREKPPEEGAK